MSEKKTYENIFSPINIGPVELKNRYRIGAHE